MKNILKKNDGAALAMIIVVSTVGIMLITTLLHLAFQNYRYSRSLNKRSTAYYIVDLGMEKTIKEIETLIESAKIYANGKIRTENIHVGGLTGYEYFVQNSAINPEVAATQFRTDYENFYKQFLTNAKFQTVSTGGAFAPLGDYSDLPGAEYKVAIDTSSFNANYRVVVTTTGHDKKPVTNEIKFERVIEADLGLNPWGYDSSGNVLIPDADDINLSEESIYESQQWARAIASSGDVIVRGGTVTVNGEIHVDGKIPTTDTVDGTKYGGLIVGINGNTGRLIVNGNIYSNNYVHTMAPNSIIDVNTSNSAALNQIYSNTTKPNYSERASTLKSNGGNPLEIDVGVLDQLGRSQTDRKYIDYVLSTYQIQRQNGGFVYADTIQIESPASNSSIQIGGSAITFDNIQTNGSGSIIIDKNYYGYMSISPNYDQSSSIAINNKDSSITFGQRIYCASTSYITAFSTTGVPYQTQEAVSLFKNYYGYRIPISSTDNSFPIRFFAPFRLIDYGSNSIAQRSHVFAYNNANSGSPYSEGGSAYDFSMIKLNPSIYDDSTAVLNNASRDMGYTQAVLMGVSSSNPNDKFIAVASPDGTNPYGGVIRKSNGSLEGEQFQRGIAHKYNTIMEVIGLKANSGHRVTINELVDNTIISGWNKRFPSTPSPDFNYLVVDGNVTIGTSGGKITATTASGTSNISNNTIYNGLILATGKITINPSANITINGAIISTTNTNNVGIEFMGNAAKTINYNKNVLLTIFKLPTSEGRDIMKYLTSKRGIIEMFTRAYDNGWVSSFTTGVNNFRTENSLSNKDEAIEVLANIYSQSGKAVLSSSVTNTMVASGTKNYKIFKWKTTN